MLESNSDTPLTPQSLRELPDYKQSMKLKYVKAWLPFPHHPWPSESTYLLEPLIRVPFNPCVAELRKEIEVELFGALDTLFEESSVKPKDIRILITRNIFTYNLCGMGCSAGLISIDFAKGLHQVHPNSYALCSLETLRTMKHAREKNTWLDEIHQFPTDVPKELAIRLMFKWHDQNYSTRSCFSARNKKMLVYFVSSFEE
ncbi:hypothetical protein FEM48_Zijuj06G0148900 [Ziziphus jujuba var. spinosa]|uniref:FAE domain-containing protein n=1 Tax=Ziziphus jujuba var. spinosa TaxID=714518 RepID=A0A978V9Y0_ZIZJJ|nr:hypothetical protein FEM48_Zijuj06G0148900 [Ziziphus jujuba var. spinosa]